MWHVGDCGVRVVGKMSKDIGMGFHPYTVFHFFKCFFFVTCFSSFFFGGGGGGGGYQSY